MMLLNTPPGPDKDALLDYYRRCATEGSVFSGVIGKQSYGLSDSFDPAWSVAALCWCAGGTETYRFPGRETVHLKAGAVLAIGENERYSYSATNERPFMSSMIVFPRAMTRSLSSNGLDAAEDVTADQPVFKTGLFRPDRKLMMRMNSMATALRSRGTVPEAVEERAALVASDLLALQEQDAQRPDRLNCAKRTTREELCRRLKRAVTLMHDTYNDPSLDLAALAREACIARHHFVRVFNEAYGKTPLRYLGEIRMEAAARLLESMRLTATEVAKAVGFSNRPAFQRRFRQHFGTSPGAWSRAEHLDR